MLHCLVEACAPIFFERLFFLPKLHLPWSLTWRSCGPRYIIQGTILLIWKEWEVTNLNYSSFVTNSPQERTKEMKGVQGLSFPVSFSELVSNTARSILTYSLWKMSAGGNFTYSLIHLLACPLSLQIKLSRLTRLSTLYKVQPFLHYVAILSSAPHKQGNLPFKSNMRLINVIWHPPAYIYITKYIYLFSTYQKCDLTPKKGKYIRLSYMREQN